MQFYGTGRIGLNTSQSAAYTGTAGTVTNGVSSGVTRVRVLVTTDAFVAMEGTPSATNGAYVPAGAAEYFTVTPGQKPSAVQVSAGGTLYVTEVS